MRPHALDSGIKQFVILATGLDARPFRLPRLDSSVTVYEVDVPSALRYREEAVAAGRMGTACQCKRVQVSADLSQPSWSDKVLAAGYKRDEPAFFLVEGLLMYLPGKGDVERLFERIGAIAAPGSLVSGDSFVRLLAPGWYHVFVRKAAPVLARYGTKWTWDLRTRGELDAMLGAVGFGAARAVSVRQLSKTHGLAGGEGAESLKMLCCLPCLCAVYLGTCCCGFQKPPEYLAYSATKVAAPASPEAMAR